MQTEKGENATSWNKSEWQNLHYTGTSTVHNKLDRNNQTEPTGHNELDRAGSSMYIYRQTLCNQNKLKSKLNLDRRSYKQYETKQHAGGKS
jgi:hypothetical protein